MSSVKIKYNKVEDSYELVSKSIFGEIYVLSSFKTRAQAKKELEKYVTIGYGYGYSIS